MLLCFLYLLFVDFMITMYEYISFKPNLVMVLETQGIVLLSYYIT